MTGFHGGLLSQRSVMERSGEYIPVYTHVPVYVCNLLQQSHVRCILRGTYMLEFKAMVFKEVCQLQRKTAELP